MELLDRIINCSQEELNTIIELLIKEANKNATKIERLGFLDNSNSNNVFKGFIPLETRIKYANLNMEDYSMQTTDYFYEFANFIRKYNINNKVALIHLLELFINNYFGYPGKISRETIFNDIAWQTTTTDEEYFKALENNKIGYLKGKGAAECTERGAMAEQLLSVFGFEVYYCMGCVDLGDRQEGHCFNIVKRKNDYAVLDYSLPITSYNKDGSVKAFYPFVGILSNEEFQDFVNNGIIKVFDNYCYRDGNKKTPLEGQRRYIVGKYEFEEEKNKANSR